MEKNLKVAFYKLERDEKDFFISLYDIDKNLINDIENLDDTKLNTYIKDEYFNEFNIKWDVELKDSSKIYLENNDEFIALLIESKKLCNSYFKFFDFENIEKINLVVTENLDIRMEINESYKKLFVISNSYICDGNKIFKIDILNNSFYEVKDLFIALAQKNIESYFSLVYKNYKNINIVYKDYELIERQKINIIPQLIIEKISIDNSLYLKLNAIISNIDYEFINNNKLENIVSIDDVNKKIYISKLDAEFFRKNIDYLIKLFLKLQKNINTRGAYYVSHTGNIILREDLAKEFIIKSLISLSSKFNIIGTEKLKKYNIKTVKPKIVGNFSYNINFLEGQAQIMIEDEKFSLMEILDNYEKNSYIVLSDGTNALINKKYIEKLERIFTKKDDDKIKLSFFDLPLIEELIDDKILNQDLNIHREFFDGLNNINTSKVNIKGLNATLREYQKYGYAWMKYLYSKNIGACLADDMGLGKTLQAIALILSTKTKEKTLIIMPKSLIFNWENEIKKFAPSLELDFYYGTTRNIKVFKKRVVLTTYGTIRNDIEKIKDFNFDLLILDESQNIKNVNSHTTKAVMLLNAKSKIALSGTPIENNLLELYSLFRFLNPAMFGSYEEFNRNYLTPIQKFKDKDTIEELRKKIYPFILRRVKKEVLKDLPEKIENTILIEMSNEHKKLYEERRNFYLNAINKNTFEKSNNKFFILQAINELRYLTACPKTKTKKITSAKHEVLIQSILEAIENNHKVLVFTNFLNSIEDISENLKKHNIKHLTMTGSTKNRQELVDKFQNDARYKVFVMTLKTGGVGLNLTAADTIFIFDPWWNQTVESQAIDRAYRIGQDKTVFSYKLILKNTIEEKILKLQNEKKLLLDDLISEDNISMKNLSYEDIEFILT